MVEVVKKDGATMEELKQHRRRRVTSKIKVSIKSRSKNTNAKERNLKNSYVRNGEKVIVPIAIAIIKNVQ